ncbi:MAG: heat-inducible transcription repressor HrcA [Deltaproteobacteria bacterium]|nr:heat-inducible transcription repressor HrcA [Deltaproteobacteria bacterium]
MELDPRAREILAAICSEYIVTGDAIGSRALVKKNKMSESAATVRNVMADLEEQGLVQKAHSSAGRIPSESGLRFFVDRLMQVRDLSTDEQSDLRRRYQVNNVEFQELLRQVTRLLTDVSRQCALLLVPRSEHALLRRLEFVPLGSKRMIAVLLMSNGLVQNRVVDIAPSEFSDRELQQVHHYLNELCAGRELHDIRTIVAEQLADERTRYDQLRERALKLGAEATARPAEDEVVVGGQSKILEHPDPEVMRSLLRAIEGKQTVLRLLDHTIEANGIQVFIGAETQDETMRGCAVVASAYGGSNALGTIGVIGPSNMDYPRVLPAVDFAAGLLTDILGKE